METELDHVQQTSDTYEKRITETSTRTNNEYFPLMEEVIRPPAPVFFAGIRCPLGCSPLKESASPSSSTGFLAGVGRPAGVLSPSGER